MHKHLECQKMLLTVTAQLYYCLTEQEWTAMALRLVRENDKDALTKAELWEKCRADEACTIPTKRQLGVALMLLRHQDLIRGVPKGVLHASCAPASLSVHEEDTCDDCLTM
jgi:hypothetical protein